MKTFKKAMFLVVLLPFFCAPIFALDYFEVSKPDIKKAAIYVSAKEKTSFNQMFREQLTDMLAASLLFNPVTSSGAADYSVTLEKSIESGELVVTIKGEKQSTYAPKFFGIRFAQRDTDYIKRRTAQMGNRIIKELFGIDGSLGSTVTWSNTEDARKVIYATKFSIPDTTEQITYNFFTNYGASWGPDRDLVIYTSHTDYGTVINLQKINPLLYKAHEIYAQSGKASSPIWAPDGTVYMTLHVSDQNSDIFKFRMEGDLNQGENLKLKKVRQMTHIPSIETEPSISPDNTKMAFVSDQTSEPQIYILDLKTQKTTRLTSKGGYNVSPAWSPSGQYIAFKAIRQGVASINRINVETKEERRLTSGGIRAEDPTWSPDGSLIAFAGVEGNKTKKIYYMLSSGGDYQRLTTTEDVVEESNPSWGPALQ